MLKRLFAALHTARPHMALRVRAVMEATFLSKGPIGSADHVATMLGLKNRFQLARLLKRERLPPLHRLSDWITLLAWVDAAERQRVSLCAMALRSGRHPSACYRLVKRLTGRGWQYVQAQRGAWVLQQFLKELRRRGS